MTFKIVEYQQHDLNRLYKIVLPVLIFSAIALAIFERYNLLIAAFILIWLVLACWLLFKQIGVLKNYIVTGELIVQEEVIKGHFYNREAAFEKKDTKDSKITLYYRGYKGLMIGRNYCYGDQNEIIIEDKTGVARVHFLIEHSASLTEIRRLLKVWHQSSIVIKEYGLLDKKSFLLETDLTYQELQSQNDNLR